VQIGCRTFVRKITERAIVRKPHSWWSRALPRKLRERPMGQLISADIYSLRRDRSPFAA
jgi:hypothetical protein